MHLESVWLLWGAVSSGIDLGANTGRAVWSPKVAGKEWVEGVVEEDLSTAELWEGEPDDEGELEEVVEWEPVGEVESGLKDARWKE